MPERHTLVEETNFLLNNKVKEVSKYSFYVQLKYFITFCHIQAKQMYEIAEEIDKVFYIKYQFFVFQIFIGVEYRGYHIRAPIFSFETREMIQSIENLISTAIYS